jgi:transposase
MNTKLHAICDSQGRPINLFVTAGQVSDYIGARALLSSLPNWNGCSGIVAMTPTGSGHLWKTKGYAPVSRVATSARQP